VVAGYLIRSVATKFLTRGCREVIKAVRGLISVGRLAAGGGMPSCGQWRLSRLFSGRIWEMGSALVGGSPIGLTGYFPVRAGRGRPTFHRWGLDQNRAAQMLGKAFC